MIWLYLFVLMIFWLIRFGLQLGGIYLSILIPLLWAVWFLSLRRQHV